MSVDSNIYCGPFELLEPRGSGSVAVVWRARHRTHGVPAAVKVIDREKARNSEYRERFRREVRSHARLNHPAIATVFDYGEIDGGAEAASDGELVAGSPYLAMEYTEGGTVGKDHRVRNWFHLRSILLQVLDGLAHAHARGVIHRDLKPDNILWFPTRDIGRFKLSDFGIAHAFAKLEGSNTQDIRDAIAGTPYYMPPEQLSGEWRNVGPWSDVYALGCVAFELLTGARPFSGGNLAEVAGQKFSGFVPDIDPNYAVPNGFYDWIGRLISKAPRDRYRRAADAAWALRQLPARVKSSGSMPAADASAERDDPGRETQRITAVDKQETDREEHRPTLTTLVVETEADDDPDASAGDATDIRSIDKFTDASDTPPFPHDWSVANTDEHTQRPTDIGLRLFGVREVPFVDRDSERSAIWNALSEVVDGEGVRAIEIRGPSGAGKSRLAEWLARRADELGVASWLRARHGRGGDRSEGLAAMIENALKAWELSRDRAFERIREALEEIAGWAGIPTTEDRLDDEARALTEVIDPTPGGGRGSDGPRYHFSSASERFDAVARLLERLGGERPVVLWIDDIQWGPDALGLVEHLMERRSELPVLLLLTVEADHIDDEVVDKRLDILAREDHYQQLSLGPLSVRDQANLINGILPLDSQVAQTVLQQTSGLPLHIIQLLGDWVDRSRLTLGDEGYVLRDEVDADSSSLEEIWDKRIDHVVRLVGGHDEEPIRKSLEAAAVLGARVDDREWRAVCARLGVPARPELVDELVRDGLVWPREDGWEFVHERLVESLRQRARDTDRLRELHATCAQVLATLHDNAGFDVQERRVDHLMTSGQLEAALDPMLDIASYFYTLDNHRDCARVLDRRSAVIESLGLGENDRRRIENLELRARVLLTENDPEGALQLVDRVARTAGDRGWRKVLGFNYITKAILEHHRGEYTAAMQSLRLAKRELEACDHVLGLARVHRERATIFRRRADFERARREYGAAIDLFDDFGFEAAQIDLENFIGSTWLAEGKLEQAETHFQTALDYARRIGSRAKEARCWHHLGEVARFREDWGRARTCCDRALEMGRRSESPTAELVHLNRALVELGAGEPDEAERFLSACRGRFPYLESTFALARCCIAAYRNDWGTWEHEMKTADRLFGETEGIERNDAWLCEQAATAAESRGAFARCRDSLRRARNLWERLGDQERADDCARRVQRMVE